MGANDFAKFVADQQTSTADAEVWGGMREEFLKNLKALHNEIVDFLQEYEKTRQITHSFTDVMLNEENIGSYFAPRMDIKIGRQYVYLEPIGTLLIGIRGRVDVVGSAGRAQILLVHEKAKSAAELYPVWVTKGGKPSPAPPSAQEQSSSWIWKIVTRGLPKKFVDIDKESLFELLMEIANA